MTAGKFFICICVALYALGAWMAFRDGKVYWPAIIMMGGASILGLVTGSAARFALDFLRGQP
ncbi:MAG: hypothetical protein KKF77_03595 [Proteobacteria bacterium]|nr:hypothetical protein [Pseudomonadota bacterium]